MASSKRRRRNLPFCTLLGDGGTILETYFRNESLLAVSERFDRFSELVSCVAGLAAGGSGDGGESSLPLDSSLLDIVIFIISSKS